MPCKDIAREVLGIPCSESGTIEGRIRELESMATSKHGKVRCLLARLALRGSYMPLGLASVGFVPVVLFLIYPYYPIPIPYLIVIGTLWPLPTLVGGFSWGLGGYLPFNGGYSVVLHNKGQWLSDD